MRDVSRVEYDAALKRVQKAWEAPVLSITDLSERFTLAALGLDEPPTEPKPFDVRDHPMAFPSHHDKRWVLSDDSPVPSDRSSTGRKDEPPTEATKERLGLPVVTHPGMPPGVIAVVVPPAEPPKACPTCDEAERRIASLRGEIKATVEEVREMQAAIDTAYSAWDSTQYVGGLTEREAYRRAMDALGPLVTQHTGQDGGSGIDGGTAT